MFIRKNPLSQNLLQTRDFNRFGNARLAIAHEIKEISTTFFGLLHVKFANFWCKKVGFRGTKQGAVGLLVRNERQGCNNPNYYFFKQIVSYIIIIII